MMQNIRYWLEDAWTEIWWWMTFEIDIPAYIRARRVFWEMKISDARKIDKLNARVQWLENRNRELEAIEKHYGVEWRNDDALNSEKLHGPD